MAVFLRPNRARASQKSRLPIILSALLIGALLVTFAGRGLPVTVRGDRWLAVADLLGNVQLITEEGSRSAKKGDRLTRVGDGLVTDTDASARLSVDEAVGSVTMAQNSHLRIRTLSITQNGGRVTELEVIRGQVRVRVRPFTSPESRLEIHTPVGISGVRGTDFGVTVQPNGQTAIATESGRVAVSAQGEEVVVSAGLQSIIRPGEPPTPAQAFRDDPTLNIEVLSSTPRSTVNIVGFTNTANIVKINGETIRFNEAGRFDWETAISGDRIIRAEVVTPLGTQREYRLVVPE